MKLMASSLVEQVNTFLHAGYVSAYPRPLEGEAYPPGGEFGKGVELIHEIDVSEALMLEGESLAANVHSAGQEIAGGTLGQFGATTELLIGTLTVTGVVVLYYLMRDRLGTQARAFIAGAAMAMALIIVAPHCVDSNTDPEPLPTDPPWEGMQTKSYANPESATLTLLYGIVGPAMANVGQTVEVLANVQNEVGLPKASLTQGEAYALQTYGLDGWGREFRLSRKSKYTEDKEEFGSYTVTSAGPDGQFDNEDDLAHTFDQMMNDSWGFSQETFFLAEIGDQIDVFYHRWNDEMFEYANKVRAQEATGCELFDVFSRDRLRSEQITAAEEAFDGVAEYTSYSPVVLQVFK